LWRHQKTSWGSKRSQPGGQNALAYDRSLSVAGLQVGVRYSRSVPPHSIIITAGLFGSGSTWMFNIVNTMLSLNFPEARLLRIYTEEFLDEDIPRDGMDCVVAKTHRPPSAVRLLARVSNIPILLTLRDPRDAVASMMRRFGYEFGGALEFIRLSGEALAPLVSSPNVLLLRYEDGFTRKAETIDAVAARLGLKLSTSTREAVRAALTPSAVSASIADLTARGTFGDPPRVEMFDPDTHWHPNHVGDGRVGKWREILTNSQAAEVQSATRDFRAAFHYPD
jgi:hypothetical protein